MMGIQVIQEVTTMILPSVLCRMSHQLRVGGPVFLLELGRVQRQLYLFHHIVPLGQLPVWSSILSGLLLIPRFLIQMAALM